MIFQVMKEAREAGIEIKVVSSDMASENQAFWKLVGVFANREGHNCLVTSPHDKQKFVMMPDPPHAIKNFKSACIKYCAEVPWWLFEKYGLSDLDPSTTVNLKYTITRLIELQNENNVVFVDGLNMSHVYPDGYQKMRMKYTLKIIDSRVVTAIEMCVAEGDSLKLFCGLNFRTGSPAN